MRTYKRNLKIPEPQYKTPYTDLIDTFPKIFGRDGTKRKQLEAEARASQFDDDHTNGIDDGEGPWNLPNNKEE